jgi:hypothetical protein
VCCNSYRKKVMGNLLESERLIYERLDKTIYARYPNRPDIPRWVISSDSPDFKYSEFVDLIVLTKNDEIFKKEFDKLITLYYIKKEENSCQQKSFL